MPRYLLLLGSNELAEQRIAQGLQLLSTELDVCLVGALLASPDRNASQMASASETPSYLNMGVEVVTVLATAELKSALRSIEARCGRTRPAAKPGICPLDIDIVLIWHEHAWHWLDLEAKQQGYVRDAFARWLQ